MRKQLYDFLLQANTCFNFMVNRLSAGPYDSVVASIHSFSNFSQFRLKNLSCAFALGNHKKLVSVTQRFCRNCNDQS